MIKRPEKTRQMHPVHDRLDELTACINSLADAFEAGLSEGLKVEAAPVDLKPLQQKLDAAFSTIGQMAERSAKQDVVFKAVVSFLMNPNSYEARPENQPDDVKALMAQYGISTSEKL
tara:strand:- start:162 stop:512 length:351 start_codon:yes stop_codon:yes gene_type:complete